LLLVGRFCLPAGWLAHTPGAAGREPPFKVHDASNRKIFLWDGELTALCVDAVVNSTNESLNESNAISDDLSARGGPEYNEGVILARTASSVLVCLMTRVLAAVRKLRVCKTGEAKITIGGRLEAKCVCLRMLVCDGV
jgi:O-acetyl-ADP-ribose deacetylase (regulator of RNase III)